jgi:predicted phosphodiesterase
MKIAFISDTHTYHENIQIPDCDILIHCGDISIYGEIFEVKNFLQWFGNQKARHKIFICGNHEVVVGNMNGYVKKMVEDHNKYYMSNIVYLEETGVEVEGLKLWGSPYTPEFLTGNICTNVQMENGDG